MNSLPALTCALGASLTALSPSQNPHLSMTAAVAPTLAGIAAPYTLTGTPGSTVAVFADLGGGPTDLFGERFYLSFSPSLTALQVAVLPSSGTIGGSIQAPLFAGLVGLVVHGQAIVLDPNAPNGLFRAGNGASTAIHSGAGAIVAGFDSPLTNGYTGSFAADVEGHVRGGPVTRRTRDTGDQSPGALLNFGLIGAMSRFGGRGQFVYPAEDLGATGEPELITAIRWAVFSGTNITPDTFPQLQLRVGHTDVVPDFTIGSFTALPLFPNSGLSTVFANNEIPGAPPVLVYQGPYVIDPAAVVFDPSMIIRYLPFPMFVPFAYDGTSSLLLDVRVPPSNALGVNGAQTRVRVQSSPNPFARVVAAGTAGNLVDPATVTTATGADCVMMDLQIEFTRAETFALSPWLDSGAVAPDYGTPVLAQSLPTGTSVQVEYRGSAVSSGGTTTAWSPSPDVADGRQFLQFRITFRANPVTNDRPLVDTLVVPWL